MRRYLRTIHTRYLIASFLQSAAWYLKADQKELDQRDLVVQEDSIELILQKLHMSSDKRRNKTIHQ